MKSEILIRDKIVEGVRDFISSQGLPEIYRKRYERFAKLEQYACNNNQLEFFYFYCKFKDVNYKHILREYKISQIT